MTWLTKHQLAPEFIHFVKVKIYFFCSRRKLILMKLGSWFILALPTGTKHPVRCLKTENSRGLKVGCRYFYISWRKTQGVTTKPTRQLDCTNRCQNPSSVIPVTFLEPKAVSHWQMHSWTSWMSDLLVASSSSESKQEVDSNSLLMKDEQLS